MLNENERILDIRRMLDGKKAKRVKREKYGGMIFTVCIGIIFLTLVFWLYPN